VLVWVAFVARGNIFNPTGELTIQMMDLKGRNMVFSRYAAARVIWATREPPAGQRSGGVGNARVSEHRSGGIGTSIRFMTTDIVFVQLYECLCG
jgi:2-keto-3-deoxy-L-rhamnonate aldolase RhmA